MRRLAFTILLAVAIASIASAQQIELKSLDQFAQKAKSKTEINMDESMLKSAAGFLDEKKPDEATARKSAESLKGFYLRSYEFDKKDVFKFEDLKPILDQLKSPNWKPFLQSKEDDEQTEIWMHQTNGQADGLLLVSAEDDEIVVINAVGITRLEDLARLGDQFSKVPNGNPKPAPSPQPAGK